MGSQVYKLSQKAEKMEMGLSKLPALYTLPNDKV